MPRMDGYESIDEFTRMTSIRHPPVLAMSTLASVADVRRSEAAGFRATWQNPFNGAAFIDVLNAALGDRPARD